MISNYISYYNSRRVQRNLGVLTPLEVVSRVMRKIDIGIWQKSITVGGDPPLGYLAAGRAQRVKGGEAVHFTLDAL